MWYIFFIICDIIPFKIIIVLFNKLILILENDKFVCFINLPIIDNS